MADKAARITGVGFAVPDQIRTNDDPVFDWIRTHSTSHSDLFQGIERRRVLAPDETLAGLMSAAATRALADSGLEAQDVDLLIGAGSVSDYVVRNAHCPVIITRPQE